MFWHTHTHKTNNMHLPTTFLERTQYKRVPAKPSGLFVGGHGECGEKRGTAGAMLFGTESRLFDYTVPVTTDSLTSQLGWGSLLPHSAIGAAGRQLFQFQIKHLFLCLALRAIRAAHTERSSQRFPLQLAAWDGRSYTAQVSSPEPWTLG